jgi:chromate transporter
MRVENALREGVERLVPERVTFGEALRVWTKIGFLSFGGPAGQIALMHSELVENRRWIDERRFLHALNYCMLLPGPEAQQLAIYIGWLMHRVPGGIVAGTLFVLPGSLAVLGLSLMYATFREQPAVGALFFGLKAAVLAVVVEAVLRIGKRALTSRLLIAVAAAAFIGIFFFNLPFPVVVLGAGIIGYANVDPGPRGEPSLGPSSSAPLGATSFIERLSERGELGHTHPSRRRALATLGVCVALWTAPLLGLAAAFGWRSVLVQEGLLFSKAAMITFGGAYAALAYVAQRAVEMYGWLSSSEMLDGLGLAETTPGPLILVVEFVAFIGAYRMPGSLPPWLAGTLGALTTLWVTFVPCFLWIFLGAPYIEALRENQRLRAALAAITAAVVGVILNLAIVFGVHVVFQRTGLWQLGPLRVLSPELESLDVAAAVLSALALIAMLRFKLGLPRTLVASAALGALWKWAR